MKNKIVKNLSLLKAMERAGKIKLHPDTGKITKHDTGFYKIFHVDCVYGFCFEFRDKKYCEKYVEGWPFPFVKEI